MAAGNRHVLIPYRRTMERLWPLALVFSLEMFLMYRFGAAITGFYRDELAPLFFTAAVYSGVLGVFALFARGYVRAFDRYFLVATPFFRFKTSYRRVFGVRAADFHRLFPFEEMSWADRIYLEPLIGKSVVVVRLSGFPLSPVILRLFFHRSLLAPGETELVLPVDDWMALSVELDSRCNDYRQRSKTARSATGFQRGLYG